MSQYIDLSCFSAPNLQFACQTDPLSKPNQPCLKVPKCENFHRTDFFYFYTIKPLWVGDFRAKIKNSKFLCLRGLLGVSFSKILC
jgi:hypothetical protein